MIVVLKPNCTRDQESEILKEIEKLGYTPHVMRGVAQTVIGAIGDGKFGCQRFRLWGFITVGEWGKIIVAGH